MKLTGESQEAKLISSLNNDLHKIYKRRITAKQKIRIINLLFTPKIRYRLNVLKIEDTTLEKLDAMTTKLIKADLGVPHQLDNSRIFNPETWGLISLADEQKISFASSIIQQGFNSNLKYPRQLLIQRQRDTVGETSGMIGELLCILEKSNIRIEHSFGKTSPLIPESPWLKSEELEEITEQKIKEYGNSLQAMDPLMGEKPRQVPSYGASPIQKLGTGELS